MSGWTIAWLIWFGVSLIWFFIIEIPAVLNDKRGDTLSEHVWTYITRPDLEGYGGRVVQLTRLGFLLFWVWLSIHFFTAWV